MYFFYTEYINVTFDTQYTFKSILETTTVLHYTYKIFMRYRGKKRDPFFLR